MTQIKSQKDLFLQTLQTETTGHQELIEIDSNTSLNHTDGSTLKTFHTNHSDYNYRTRIKIFQ